MPNFRNALAGETSLYLRQHADNPVAWHPWGPDALALAREQKRPILLSIGYSACHWCHVMAHESFENPDIAAVMNELFVNIKVDREERPDLDRIYQTAHHLLSGRSGGWPLTVFLTHDTQMPIFSGTYFPNRSRHGLPAFPEILQRVAAFYTQRQTAIQEQSSAMQQAFQNLLVVPDDADTQPDDSVLAAARQHLDEQFDPQFGGFGGAPKFPRPTSIAFLLRRWHATRRNAMLDADALVQATTSLTRMAQGGLYDHVGGGFFRYSVDREWRIPHFEKMLYDNALLLELYAEAAQATGDAHYRRVVEQTFTWLQRQMTAADGTFHATLDADAGGHEGLYYVWQPAEVRELLPAAEYQAFAPRYGLQDPANFEGRWHLQLRPPIGTVAASREADADTQLLLAAARGKLLAKREEREAPGRDEKILTSWNGMTIAALARAARLLDHETMGDAARRAMRALHDTLWRDSRWAAGSAEHKIRPGGYLDDHAWMLHAALRLLELRWEPWLLTLATDTADALLAHFADVKQGGFFFTAHDHERLLYRPKDFGDDATPAGNAIAAAALQRLGWLLGESRYLDAAERTLRAAWPLLRQHPQAHFALLEAVQEFLHPVDVLVIRADDDASHELIDAAHEDYDPRRLVFRIPSSMQALPEGLRVKTARAAPVAYLCRGTVCSSPLVTATQLRQALAEPALD